MNLSGLNMAKLILAVFPLLLMGLPARAMQFSQVSALPQTPALQEASKLVVLLEIKSNGTVGSGSGFILSANPNTKTAWIMTAAHCIYCKNTSSCEVSAKGVFGKLKADLRTLRFDTLNDMAVIQVQLPKKSLLSIQAPFARASEMHPGDRAVWFGDPSLELRETKLWVLPRPKDYKKRGVRFTDGKVQAFSDHFPVVNPIGGPIQYVKNLLLYGETLPGNSGGPVFNSRGKIVGIIIKTLDDKRFCTTITDTCYPVAAPSDVLVEFASKNVF